MLLYFKNYHPHVMAHKLSMLYLLNLVELILSMILFHADVSTVTNPVVIYVMNHPWLMILLKASLPAILLGYLFYYLTQTESAKIIHLSNLGISALLVIYGFMNLVHLSNWILDPIIQSTQ